MADEPKKPIALSDLAVAAAPAAAFADLARKSTASEFKPGQKVYLNRTEPVGASADLERILALPRREPPDLEGPRGEALADMMTARWTRGERVCACGVIDKKIAAGKRKCLKRLKPVQAWALYEMGIVGGLMGAISVGGGKSLVDILAVLALEPLGVRHALLLIPPNLAEQLERDYRLIREHFVVPAIFFHGLEKRYEIEGAPKLHVLPYSRLSLPNASSWVRDLRPQAIIADEADRLRDPNGAGSSRILRYAKEFGNTHYVFLTGSITESGIEDYGHLSALALRMSSPTPLDPGELGKWGKVIDESDNPAQPGELSQLCPEKPDPNVDDVREGFHRRLSETMGFVISTASSAGDVDIVIEERPAPPIPAIITEALYKVRTMWVRPDTLVGSDYDEELVDAMQVAKCARELASGIFYRWRFDPINGVPQRQVDIDEWLEARKDWNRELRYRLTERDEWLDSPLLCEHAAQRHHGDRPRRDDRPDWDSEHWPRWAKIKGRVKPTTEACRVSDYLARDAAEWARTHHGIVWYGMVEFGQWVSELSGLTLHGGGPKAGQAIADEVGRHSIIASIKSHGRGRDGLQSLYAEQLIAQIPSGSAMNQQLLGRLHRQGQDKAEVRTWYYAHTQELKNALETAMGRAAYVRSTIGEEQKLLTGLRR